MKLSNSNRMERVSATSVIAGFSLVCKLIEITIYDIPWLAKLYVREISILQKVAANIMNEYSVS